MSDAMSHAGRRLFVTGTGTGVGKTWVSRGLTLSLRRRGVRVAALKPIETGCDPTAEDAHALARAAGEPALATAAGFYRARPPLAPYAATLAGEPAPPTIGALCASIDRAASGAAFTVVEGAGGLCVPLDVEHDIAELAVAFGAPVLLVARDRLGVLSHTLTAAEAACSRGLAIAAVVLVRDANGGGDGDGSAAYNATILAARLAAPIVCFEHCDDDDDALADEAERSGLLALFS